MKNLPLVLLSFGIIISPLVVKNVYRLSTQREKQKNEIVQTSLYKEEMRFLADNCWGKSTFALAFDPTMANMCMSLASKIESRIVTQYNKMKSFIEDCPSMEWSKGFPGIDSRLASIDALILLYVNEKLFSDFEKKCLPNFNKEELQWLEMGLK